MRDWFRRSMEVIVPLGAVIGVLFPLGGVIYYWVSIESDLKSVKERLSLVENQVRVVAAAPAIKREPGTLYTQQPNPSHSVGTDYSEPIVNPLITTCRDLYSRVATAVEKQDRRVQESLNGYMRELGCAEVIKQTAPH